MARYNHLPLPVYQGNVERKKRKVKSAGYKCPEGRNKREFSQTGCQKADEISSSFKEIKKKFSGKINTSLIYEIKINQSVSPDAFEKILASMGIHVLSVAENKKGYWVVFSEDEALNKFKEKLSIYGSDEGPKYDFFNAIESFRDIPREEKIGKLLNEKPLTNTPGFIDIELWRLETPEKNEKFIQELNNAYKDKPQFRITDRLITKSFVLCAGKANKEDI